MVASEQQVGEEITCPDCGTKTIVPPLVPVLAKEVPAADIQEGYALRTDPGQPRPESVVGQEYYAVRCPVCATRLHATPDQVGTTMVCPDCRKGFVVPPPPPPKAVLDVEPLQAYDLRAPVERTYELGPAAEPDADDGPPRPTRRKRRERGAGRREKGAGSGERGAGRREEGGGF
jgi:DNA-directed RNA polymerase subunit RPC12/RpoP